MANTLQNDFRERGALVVHVITDDSPDPDTTVGWTDAQYWANSMDFNGDSKVDPLNVLVLADTDGGIWARFAQCPLTPQGQILDQGGLTVDDPCVMSNLCGGCGYSDSQVRGVLNTILPAKWCGEATP